jgi:hypothetical protein
VNEHQQHSRPRAEIRFHEAAEALRPFVGCFWVVTAERGATIRVVPDGSTAVSIQLQDGRPSEWFLRGPLVRPDERHFASPAILIDAGRTSAHRVRSSAHHAVGHVSCLAI